MDKCKHVSHNEIPLALLLSTWNPPSPSEAQATRDSNGLWGNEQVVGEIETRCIALSDEVPQTNRLASILSALSGDIEPGYMNVHKISIACLVTTSCRTLQACIFTPLRALADEGKILSQTFAPSSLRTMPPLPAILL